MHQWTKSKVLYKETLSTPPTKEPLEIKNLIAEMKDSTERLQEKE